MVYETALFFYYFESKLKEEHSSISIVPLAVMGLEKKSQGDADLQKVSKRKYVKVIPLENGDRYCPDCGEYNQPHTFHCKSCGREFGAS